MLGMNYDYFVGIDPAINTMAIVIRDSTMQLVDYRFFYKDNKDKNKKKKESDLGPKSICLNDSKVMEMDLHPTPHILENKNETLHRIKNQLIRSYVSDLFSPGKSYLVAVEDYAFAEHGQVFAIGELVGYIKNWLFKNRHHYTLIAPTQLKKFVCGKGNVKKSEMVLAAYKKWGSDFSQHGKAQEDLVDADCLCRFINYCHTKNYSGLTNIQKQCINDFMNGLK